MKKFFKFILLIIICFIVFISIVSIWRIVIQYKIKEIPQRLLGANSFIESASILFAEGYVFDVQLALKINLTKNRHLTVERMNENMSGNIRITKIGNYIIGSYNSDESTSPYIHKNDIERNTGIILRNIIDILNNYDEIYSFVKTLNEYNLDKHKSEYLSFDILTQFWDDTKIYENYKKNRKSVFMIRAMKNETNESSNVR
jgi:hypothetical protein